MAPAREERVEKKHMAYLGIELKKKALNQQSPRI
jgi:hypothetical protein